jgi:hypothetical protein
MVVATSRSWAARCRNHPAAGRPATSLMDRRGWEVAHSGSESGKYPYLVVHSDEMGRHPSPSPKLSDSVPQ